MGLETGSLISDLVSTNPLGTDLASTLDDHARLIKACVKGTFPNITAAVTVTAAQLNAVGASTVTGIANPTGTIGLSAVNGVATTVPRSDSAPALSQAIAPTWTAQHNFTNSGLFATNSSSVHMSAAIPLVQWTQTNGSTDNKRWAMYVVGEAQSRAIVNDAGNISAVFETVNRTDGATVDSIAWVSTALTWNGNAVLSSTSSLPAANLTGSIADARVPLSNVSQHAGSISTRNVPGLAGTAVTVQSDPGGVPSGSAGELFLYY